MASASAVKPRRLRSSGICGALANPSSTEHLRRAARGGDALAGLFAEGVDAHREGAIERAVAEALHWAPPAYEPARAQLLRSHGAPGGKAGELLQVHDRVLDATDRPEAALGQPPLERHLPTL